MCVAKSITGAYSNYANINILNKAPFSYVVKGQPIGLEAADECFKAVEAVIVYGAAAGIRLLSTKTVRTSAATAAASNHLNDHH